MGNGGWGMGDGDGKWLMDHGSWVTEEGFVSVGERSSRKGAKGMGNRKSLFGKRD